MDDIINEYAERLRNAKVGDFTYQGLLGEFAREVIAQQERRPERPYQGQVNRIDSARKLRELADQLGVRRDWHEPDEQELTARVEGYQFDNAGFWPPSQSDPDRYAPELCVILTQNGGDVAAVNLATLLAMASYPDGPTR